MILLLGYNEGAIDVLNLSNGSHEIKAMHFNSALERLEQNAANTIYRLVP